MHGPDFPEILASLSEAELLAVERDWARFLSDHLDLVVGDRFINGRPLTPTAYVTAREMVSLAREQMDAIHEEIAEREMVAR